MAGAQATAVEVAQTGASWIVRVVAGNGKTQQFECATEAQARKLAATMALPSRTK